MLSIIKCCEKFKLDPLYSTLYHGQGYPYQKIAKPWATFTRCNAADYLTYSIGYPSKGASSSKWHAWFASHYLGRRLSTWPPRVRQHSALSAVICRFRLVWCHENSAELLQPQDLAGGTFFQPSCIILTSIMDCSNDSWRDTFLGSMNTALCDFWYAVPYRMYLIFMSVSRLAYVSWSPSFLPQLVPNLCGLVVQDFVRTTSSILSET